MAKIVIAGDAAVVTSTMKLRDLETIEKYSPKSLVLKGGEDGKEPIFAISTTKGKGEITKFGATFCSETHDDNKLATITMTVGEVEGDVREFIAEKFGSAMMNLNKLEESLPEVLAQIGDDREKVLDSITIAQ